MLDAAPETHSQTDAWKDRLAPGDVVSYRFPVAEIASTALPKARPCLVLDVVVLGDTRMAVLAYGTTSATDANRGYEIQLKGRQSWAAAGLHQATRFVAARRVSVSLDHPAFVICRTTNSPILGRLSGAAWERMQTVRARLHAEHDIAVERRESRRRARSGPAVRDVDFTVETRRNHRRISSGEMQR